MAEFFTSHELRSGWSFKESKASEDSWLSVACVPTNVHLDLIAHKIIADPFIGFNELDCQWVGEREWIYRVTLPDTALSSGQSAVLAFDGLDTFASVKLDGETILESDNMFIPHRVEVTDKLRDGKKELTITFSSALLRGREIKDAHPEHKWVGYNGDMSRLAVRKAQYHWGWDWGPILMTCGPWKAVRLEIYQSRIADLRIDYTLDSSLRSASGTIIAHVQGTSARRVSFTGALDKEAVFKSTADVDDCGIAKVDFYVNQPKLWYPHGYGSQPLYEVSASIHDEDGYGGHSASSKVGFRKVELVQEKDQLGKSFYFRINGVDVFCGGSDWIPADSFTPRISAQRYRKWLQLMVDGNQVMIRVWGGGIWEDDKFYEICDELGILVWQDFLFGCGNYPTFPSLLKSIYSECTAQVRRLRHHPSLTIYAGNNEDYQIQEQMGLHYNYADKDPESWLKSDFPARYIYEKLLPEVVTAESPTTPYHPGSPWGDGKPTSDPTVGDLHQWNVWHGTQEKYQTYDTLGGRFNSEFGMEAFPHIDTIKAYVTDRSQLYPQSHMLDFHNKAAGHERRIATYMVENFRTRTDLPGFIHLTQLSQAEAMMYAYRGWRRQWGSATPHDKQLASAKLQEHQGTPQYRHCGGALVWQLNDCWPVTSWSITDYYLRKKPAYYAMARVLAPLAVAVKRAHHDWSVVHARPAKTSDYELWVASSKTTAVRVTVELRFVSIETGNDIKPAIKKENIMLTPNATTDVVQGSIDNVSEEPHVLAARLLVDGECVARDTDWPQPLKYLSFTDREVSVQSEQRKGKRYLRINAARPTKGLVFEEREGVLVSDSAIDVVPGDEQVVRVTGLKNREKELGWRYLAMEEDENGCSCGSSSN